MDNNTDVPKMQSSECELGTLRPLTRVIPEAWPQERMWWLWQQIKTQDYAFDDLSENNPQVFLGQVFMPGTELYEIGDDGLVMISGVTPHCTAFVHFVIWGEVSAQEIFDIQRKLFDHIFTAYSLNRLTAFIPSFNKQAIRMAALGGFKYEGEMRGSFLKHGKYHNVHFYGLLKDEFYKRGRVS
jgi:RimJ/RimL family protein N-acetyltransferase